MLNAIPIISGQFLFLLTVSKKKTSCKSVTNRYILHTFQSCFRKHQCSTALSRLLDDWYNQIDKGIGTKFLDPGKAFDLVDHNILLNKLKLYHFSNDALKIFKS